MDTEKRGFTGTDVPNYNELLKCVKCGLCLGQCPTYRELGVETDSPRGRIHLMKVVSQGQLGISDGFVKHIEMCLECRACESVCPSGVRYGSLIEATRTQIRRHHPSPLPTRFVRWAVLNGIFPSPGRLELATRLLRMYQRFGARGFARRFGLMRTLPWGLSDIEKMLPVLPDRSFRPDAEVTPARGDKRHRVAFFSTCVMSLAFGPINDATVRVLARNGCEVVVPRGQKCCGAIHAHAGDKETARQLARHNIKLFEKADVEAVVLNSAGCGAMLKEYGELLKDDPNYAQRAKALSAKVKDISEFLAASAVVLPVGEMKTRVTYQDPCHLAHAQGIKAQPRALLRSIPGVELVEMKNSDTCCGSAGIYSLTHHKLSMQVLDRKMMDIAATGAPVIVTANPGCLIQLMYGVQRTGLNARVMHIVELLDEAYNLADKPPTTP